MATKAAKGSPVWGPEEKAQMVAARPEIAEPGKSVIDMTDLIFAAQEVLPKKQRRPRKAIYDSLRAKGIEGPYAASFREFATQALTRAGEESQQLAKKRFTNDEYVMLGNDEEVKPLVDQLVTMDNSEFAELIVRAQARQIDAPRRRDKKSIMQANYGSGGSKRISAIIAEASKQKPPRPVVPLERPQSVREAIAEQQAEAQVSTPDAPLAPVQAAIGSPLGTAIAGLANVFIGQLKKGVMDALSQSFDTTLAAAIQDATGQLERSNLANIASLLGGTPQQEAAPQQIETPAKPKGQRVDVVGLLNGQAQELKKAAGDSFDIRCFTAKEAEHQELTAPYIILVSGHISHAAQDRAKAAGAHIVHANGRTSSVLKALQELRH